jgi:Helix-turn-helix domain of transposase family ISL3
LDDKSLYAAILGLGVSRRSTCVWPTGRCTSGRAAEGHTVGLSRVPGRGPHPRPPQARIAPPGHLSVPDPGARPVPRLSCPTHGIRQVRVPLAETKSRFTALFEALAIDWMKHAAIATVAERLRLSWDEAAGISPGSRARARPAPGNTRPPPGDSRDSVRPAPPVRHRGDRPTWTAPACSLWPTIGGGRA